MSEIAVLPRYGTEHPNERLVLFEGTLRLTWDGGSADVEGSVHLVWEPYPRLSFDCVLGIDDADLDLNVPFSVEIETLENGGRGTGLALSMTITMDMEQSTFVRTLGGVVFSGFTVGNPAPTEEVVFHVPNFPKFWGTNVEATIDSTTFQWTGRLNVATSKWEMDIDAIHNLKALWEELTAQGGFGLTHVGRLKRPDGKAFKFKDIAKIVDILGWGLSLLRSERTGPMLICGMHDGEVVWEIWSVPRVASWISMSSWMPHTQLLIFAGPADAEVSPVFQGLLDASSEPKEESGLRRAIDWYTQSVQSDVNATTVILAQAGLELMSWMRLVDDGVVSEEGFKRLDAADALRIALELAKVDLAVPNGSEQLFAATQADAKKGLSLLDGPGAVVEIRNGTIHPKAKERLSEPQVMNQGGMLAIRYLELLLLNRLGYRGHIRNRAAGAIPEPAPWV